MKIDAKLAELVPLSHKFAKQSRVRIFHDECTRSTPLDPKLMFRGVSDRFVTARKSMQTGRTGDVIAQVCLTMSRRILSQRTPPIHSIGSKTHVLGRFGPFRYCMKVDAKLAERVLLTHKFAKQSRVRIFRNDRTRSTPLDPKLMFWGGSDRFVAARKLMQNWPNCCHYRTSTNKVAPEFSQRTHPIHSIGPKTHILGRFGPFRCSTKFDAKLTKQVPLTHKFAKESRV
jgi:hypothetical protein